MRPPPRGERGFGPDFREKRHPLVRVRASAAHGARRKNPAGRLSQSGFRAARRGKGKTEIGNQISEVGRQKNLGAGKVKMRLSKAPSSPAPSCEEPVKAKFKAESRSRPVLCKIFDLRVEVDVIKNIFVRIVDRNGEVSRGRKIQGGGAVGHFSAGRFGALFKIIPAVLGLGDIA